MSEIDFAPLAKAVANNLNPTAAESFIPRMAAEITRLTAELAEARDKALDEAEAACEAHPEEGSEDLGPGIALAIEIIRALKSPEPPIL